MRDWIRFGVLMFVAATVLGCGSEPDVVGAPAEQASFFNLNKQCALDYAGGVNDIQTSLTFNQCNELRGRAATSAVNWVGKITEISTDQGADVVAITIEARINEFDIAFATVGTALSDLDTTTLITPSNRLFNVLAAMKEGDVVEFDASFLPHPDGDRRIWESSLTERGSMEAPEFIVRFSDVRPYNPSPSEAAEKRATVSIDVPKVDARSVAQKSVEEEMSDTKSEHLSLESGARPSFDCASASNETEHTICANSTLARVDTYTAEMYKCLRSTANSDPSDLQQKQQAWVTERNLCASDIGCLRAVYGRIAETYMELEGFDTCQARATSSL